MKKISKYFMAIAMAAFLIVPALSISANQALAQDYGDDDVYGRNVVEDNVTGLGESNKDPKELITDFINLALGFLGLIAVIIILIGGFKWMTSGGNEEKTTAARKLLVAGVVGLVIVLASWGLASWLIGTVAGQTGGA
ncbi:MAG: pilin [Patescibacteria group bacterium]|jgi:hypothetical protein|nr:pilin [Patescibacteria group bacterium]